MRLGVDELGSWTHLRALRSSPPGLAAGKEKNNVARRETFGAALEQGEQLWNAAAGVRPESKPLLLFYGLTQAGRAILAAFHEDDDWREGHHGLTFPKVQPGRPKPLNLTEVMVEADGRGLPQKVSDLVGGGFVNQDDGCSLEDVISVIDNIRPEDLGFALPHGPLVVHEKYPISEGGPGGGERLCLSLLPVPSWGLAERVSVEPDLSGWKFPAVTKDQAADWLAPYLLFNRVGVPDGVVLGAEGFDDDGVPIPGLLCKWKLPHAARLEFLREAVDRIHGNSFRFSIQGVLSPRLPGLKERTPTLMAWWISLYQMSMLARYYPREWTLMLNPDRSALAVPLERLLNEAVQIVPFVIRDTIKDLAKR